jgi:hypothetical protein
VHQIPMPTCRLTRKRRQHVMPDPQPSSFGNICHGIALRNAGFVTRSLVRRSQFVVRSS